LTYFGVLTEEDQRALQLTGQIFETACFGPKFQDMRLDRPEFFPQLKLPLAPGELNLLFREALLHEEDNHSRPDAEEC